MVQLQFLRKALAGCLFALLSFALMAQELPRTRAQALQALQQPSAPLRLAAVQRLGDIGTMADADRLVASLRDENEQIRVYASVSMWQNTQGLCRAVISRPIPMFRVAGSSFCCLTCVR